MKNSVLYRALAGVACCLVLSLHNLRAQAVNCPVDTISPGNVGNAISATERYLNCLQAATGSPGLAMAVVYKDQVLLLKGYGARKAGDPGRVDEDTIFELASFSKPISSTIVASLVGTGDVSWMDKVVDLDPSFALSDPTVTKEVTVRDLFSHRSGLPDHVGDSLEELGYTRSEILERLRYVPLTGTFRKTYAYTNFGLTEGAIAPALKVGRRWEDLAEERLFQRLGMSRSSYRFSDYQDALNKAALHVYENGTAVNRYVRDADAEAPAGGVSSSVKDLAQWLRLQLGEGTWNGEQIVQWLALEQTHLPLICTKFTDRLNVCDPNAGYYGLGWDVSFDEKGKKTLSHSGAFLLGASTTVRMIPADQIGVIVLSNTQPLGVPESIALTFLDLFEQGKPRMDWYPAVHTVFQGMLEDAENASTNYSTTPKPPSPAPSGPLSGYVGKYFNQYYGTAEITLDRGQLALILPPVNNHFDLSHWNGDTFTYYIAGESSSIGRRGVRFQNGGSSMLIENLVGKDDKGVVYQNGVFTKVSDR